MEVRLCARLVARSTAACCGADLPCAFCQVLRADLLTSCGVRGGVSVKVQCAPTVTVRLPLATCAFAACANPNLSLRRACASFRLRRRRRLTLSPSWRS
jgi:hypothetical protein